MTRSVFRRRKSGFTLVEVMLASVAGSAVLMALAYTSREMSKAVEAVHHEAFLQTVVRELQYNLEDTVPIAISDYVNSYADPSTVPDIPIYMPKYSAQPVEHAYGYFSLGMGAQAFMLAAKPTPVPTATPTPAPTSTPGTSWTPIPTSPEPTHSGPVGEATQDPNALNEDYAENAEVTLGTFKLRFDLPQRANGIDAGRVMLTRGADLASAVPFGTRGMIKDAKFAYGQIQPLVANHDYALDFALPHNLKPKMLRMTTTLQKGDMVPYYLHAAWTPRATKWSWDAGPTIDPTIDYDGDGVTGPADPSPFGEEPPPPTTTTGNPNGGLIPAMVFEGNLLTNPRPVPGVTVINIFDGASKHPETWPDGENMSEEKGWTSMDGDGDAQTLKDATDPDIEDPPLTYVNPNDPTDHILDPGDPIYNNTGNSISGAKELVSGEYTVMVWDKILMDNGEPRYNLVGFAKVGYTAGDYDSQRINAVFLGWADVNGNLVEDLSAVGPG